jgi:hypothetical protein
MILSTSNEVTPTHGKAINATLWTRALDRRISELKESYA